MPIFCVQYRKVPVSSLFLASMNSSRSDFDTQFVLLSVTKKFLLRLKSINGVSRKFEGCMKFKGCLKKVFSNFNPKSRHAKRLFLSGNRNLASEMSR